MSQQAQDVLHAESFERLPAMGGERDVEPPLQLGELVALVGPLGVVELVEAEAAQPEQRGPGRGIVDGGVGHVVLGLLGPAQSHVLR